MFLGFSGLILLGRDVEAAVSELASAITMVIKDSEGNVVPHNSPATLIEGRNYSVLVTVINSSALTGTPVDATFAGVCSGGIAGGATFWNVDIGGLYLASEAKAFDIPFSVPAGLSGSVAIALAEIRDPNGVLVASAIEQMNITSDIVYAASVSFSGLPA